MKEMMFALLAVCVIVFAAWRIQAWHPLYGSAFIEDVRKRRRRIELKRLLRLWEKLGPYDNGDSK